MLADLQEALSSWRLIHLLGLSTLRARYARSRLGQTWLTLANGIFIVSIGMVWSMIWQMDIQSYLPHIGVGQIIYMFLAQSINESAGVLVADARLYINDRRPFVISSLAHVYRHFIIFLHNLPILVIIVLWSQTAHFIFDWRLIPAVVLSIVFLVCTSYALSLVCARFRDLTQIVNVVMQISFLLTPVMWQMSFIPEEYRVLFYTFNPLAAMLEALRNPVIGEVVPIAAHVSIAGWTALAVVLASLMHRLYGRRIIFWL